LSSCRAITIRWIWFVPGGQVGDEHETRQARPGVEMTYPDADTREQGVSTVDLATKKRVEAWSRWLW
jgi:hypothetical protein